MSKKLTKEEFIKRAKEVHGNKYNYDKVDYINNHTGVIITCPKHGDFLQTPRDHMSGHGCSKCYNERRGETLRSTKEEFIEKARKKHGDKYNYDKVDYINSETPIIITCPEHGDFSQLPRDHIRGNGCPYCAGTLKSNTEEFREKAKEVHGDKYDYSKVDYVNNKTNVIIVCSVHGEFEQAPYRHLQGCGCPYCSGNIKKTTENFINDARRVHGDKYNYDKVDYVSASTKVIITCPEHGDFSQLPTDHLGGHGCPHCAGTYKPTTEEFIKKAREIHGDKYDYSKVDYVNATTPVIITCPEHGDFLQAPNTHLDGHGCSKCAGKYMDTEYFKEKAREIHGDKYDYSKVDYVDNKTPIIIICPEHGEFLQKPSVHLGGSGCPKCRSSMLEKNIENLLITNNILFESQKTFDWLKNIKNLPLDFYLPDYNIAIECQGIQHFQSVDHFGGEEGFMYRIENDKLKLDLCTEHGIKVIYYSDLSINYPYEVFEDLDEILKIIKNI